MIEKSITEPKTTPKKYITFLIFLNMIVLFFILGLMGYSEKFGNILAVDSDSTQELRYEQESQEAMQEQEEIKNSAEKAAPETEDRQEAESLKAMTETEVLENQGNSKKIVYLTFDDGPTPATGKLLDVLAEYNVKATFFMLEPNMRKYPEALRRIVKEGHAVGLHGVSHKRHEFYRSKDTVVGEMVTAQVTLKELTGVESHLIRVPFGSYPDMKKSYIEAVHQADFFLWDWNVDSKDWFYNDKGMIDNTIRQLVALEKRNIEPVILMHDRVQTLPYVAKILEYLINNNYDIRIINTEIKPVTFR